MFYFFWVLFCVTILVSFLFYIPYLLFKKTKKLRIIKCFLIFNFIANLWYILVFMWLIYVVKTPINSIGWLDIMIPTIYLVVFISIFTFLKKSNLQPKKTFFMKLIIPSIIWIGIFSIDYARCQNNSRPIFCTSFNSLITAQDGGTVVYWGIGYKVFDFNRADLKCKYICPIFTDYRTAYNKELKKLVD